MFDKKNKSLIYPKDIWKKYPIKNVLIDNLSHLLTINMAIVADFKELNYSTASPLFKNQFDKVVFRSIAHSVTDYKIDTSKIIKRFMNIKYDFHSDNVKMPNFHQKGDYKAVVPLSCGKDSIMTLAVCNELGLKPVCVYINDTISPPENKIKMDFIDQVSERFGNKVIKVINEIEQLNDFETWDAEESTLPYMHMITGFCFISLPITNYFNARYIVIGNQQNMNFSFMNKDGYSTFPSYDQTDEWQKQQSIMTKMMTNGTVSVLSVIKPLTNIAIMKILFNRYKEYTKFLICCDCLDISREKRWCHDCNKCARLQLMIKAVSKNVSEGEEHLERVGFHTNLLQKKYLKHYCLFDGKEVDCYEKSKGARDEQLLSFYLAYKKGFKGALMDLFEKKFLKEARAREDELMKKFFKIYEADIPREFKSELFKIYRDGLGE
ncbi:hypothetical protein ACFL1H_07670 [Nanoarchaeota archaeon]